MKVRRTKENMYAVIGLGRFGFALAQRLAESGAELIVVDKEESVINDATAFTDNAFLVNELTRENLSNIGIQNCDTVIVGIGGKIDVSILTTLTVIQLGVPRVIAKANSVNRAVCWRSLGRRSSIRSGIWAFVWQTGCLRHGSWSTSPERRHQHHGNPPAGIGERCDGTGAESPPAIRLEHHRREAR